MRPHPPSAPGIELASATRRVAMRDVDAAGIVYLAAPYAWQEEMWTGFLYDKGRPLSKLLATGVGGPAVASSASYSAPVGLDAVLRCCLFAEVVGERSFGLRMDASFTDGPPALSVAVRHVWCTIRGNHLEPRPLPHWLRQLLSVDQTA